MKQNINSDYYEILKKAFELECIEMVGDIAGGYALHGNLEKYIELLKIDLGEGKVIKVMGKTVVYMDRITGRKSLR